MSIDIARYFKIDAEKSWEVKMQKNTKMHKNAKTKIGKILAVFADFENLSLHYSNLMPAFLHPSIVSLSQTLD